jgi:hypothetical protein
MNDAEMEKIRRAAKSHGRNTSEFSRHALLTAAEPIEIKGKEYPLGAWKGRASYKKVMKLLRG